MGVGGGAGGRGEYEVLISNGYVTVVQWHRQGGGAYRA